MEQVDQQRLVSHGEMTGAEDGDVLHADLVAIADGFGEERERTAGLGVDGVTDIGPVQIGGNLVGGRISVLRDVQQVAATSPLDAGLEQLAAGLVRRLGR